MTDSLSISLASSHASPLTAQDYWTADQLKVMQGLGLPTWFRPTSHEPSAAPTPTPTPAPTLAPVLTLPRAPVAWLVIANTPLGEAAQTLWVNMLASVGKRPEDAYVLPLLPLSSTETDPFSDVAQAGLAAVQAHITALQPQLLVTLGTLAAQALVGVEDELTGFAGELHEYEGLPLLVMQHPEALLKQPQLKAQAWRDLNLV